MTKRMTAVMMPASKVTAGRTRVLPRSLDGDEVEAEEEGGGDPVEIAPEPRRIDLEALPDEGDAASKAKSEARRGWPFPRGGAGRAR